MARMIPARFPDTTPHSERRIFEHLKSDPATSDWTVLHSLGLTGTRIGPYGEIDFVVLIPGKGILCLEVKGGEVSCDDGVWKTRNRLTGKTSRYPKSPYMQARESMFALRKLILDHFGEGTAASGCPLAYAVVFPDVIAPPLPSEAEDWETIDLESLKRPISAVLGASISATIRKIGLRLDSGSTSAKAFAEIQKFLRPDFEQIVVRSTTIARSEAQLISLTEQQYRFLDIAEVNRRAVVLGHAGTGKTVLAIELARRQAADGLRVLFLCFNRVLGGWLRSQFPVDEFPTVQVSTFHTFLKNQVENSSFASEFEEKCENTGSEEIFRTIFPYFGELAVCERGTSFDSLVVDEAQDLLTETNAPVFNMLLRGGLAGGKWTLFGDFARQALYGTQVGREEEARELIHTYCPGITILPLNMNCRNTRPIAQETALLSGFESLPFQVANVEGLAVDYRYWSSRKDEAEQLKKILIKLLKEGVEPESIVILSPVRLENSVASDIREVSGVPVSEISEITGPAKGCIVFSTIHSFKGMESPVVILCDLEDISSDRQRSILYVGMSRARSHLVLLLNSGIRSEIANLAKLKLEKGW